MQHGNPSRENLEGLSKISAVTLLISFVAERLSYFAVKNRRCNGHALIIFL